MKKCYEVATNASSCDEHTEDILAKLDAMNSAYHTKNPPSKVVIYNVDATIDASSKKVISPHVVRGKGRPSSLRKKSMIERRKPTTKTTTQKEKHKELHGIEDEVTGTCRQLFGQTDVDIEQNVTVQLLSELTSPINNGAMLAVEDLQQKIFYRDDFDEEKETDP